MFEYETRQIDDALERFREQEQLLYDENGERLWSDTEHERRYQTLLDAFDRTRDAIIQQADRKIEEASTTLVLEHRDLSDSLTNEELERANTKRAYVEDDVWNLPLGDVVMLVRAAQAANDKPTMFLYARTLQRRVDTEYEADNVNERTAKDVRELEELAPALTQAVRGPEAERKLEKAGETIRDANSLKLLAGEVRRKADGTEARQLEEARAHIYGLF